MGVLMKSMASTPRAAELPIGDRGDLGAVGTARRAARYDLEETVRGPGGRTVILNLSETGMLIRTDAKLKVGDTVHVNLPNVGETAAEVVRATEGEDEYGCRLFVPISRATVSATALAAHYDPPVDLEPVTRHRRPRGGSDRQVRREDNQLGAAISLMGLIGLFCLVAFTLSRIF